MCSSLHYNSNFSFCFSNAHDLQKILPSHLPTNLYIAAHPLRPGLLVIMNHAFLFHHRSGKFRKASTLRSAPHSFC